MHDNTRIGAFGIAAALAIAFSTVTATQARAESVLRIAMTAADIPDWRGQPDQGFEGYRFVGYSLYDTLIKWDLSSEKKEVQIRPGLATKWWVDPKNHNRWLFTLRKGVKFHDGCAWNADNAVWNFKRLIDKNAPGFTPYNFARARSRTSNIADVEKVDDETIAFTTKSPSSMFPYNMPYLYMLSECAVKADGNDLDKFAKHPVGSGPYKFSRVVLHQRLELVKNPDYWDKTRIPKQDRVVLLPMPEATTRVAALLSGQVNFVEAPPPDAMPELKARGMQIYTNVYPHTWPYILNTAKGPFKDLRVRQAANYAINRQAMVELLDGYAKPSYGVYVPSQDEFYGHPIEYKYNPKKATELLKAAGCYPCTIRVAISTSGSGQMQPLPMNELVKEQLEAVGFKVTFDTLDWNSLLDVFIKGQQAYRYDAINFSSGATDPLNFLKGVLTQYKSPNGSNWGWFSDPKVDALGKQALTAFDPKAYVPLIRKIHEQVVADARNIFIVSDVNPRALAPNLHHYVEARSWFQDITPITVGPQE